MLAVLIYHSGTRERGIVGLASIVSGGHPDGASARRQRPRPPLSSSEVLISCPPSSLPESAFDPASPFYDPVRIGVRTTLALRHRALTSSTLGPRRSRPAGVVACRPALVLGQADLPGEVRAPDHACDAQEDGLGSRAGRLDGLRAHWPRVRFGARHPHQARRAWCGARSLLFRFSSRPETDSLLPASLRVSRLGLKALVVTKPRQPSVQPVGTHAFARLVWFAQSGHLHMPPVQPPWRTRLRSDPELNDPEEQWPVEDDLTDVEWEAENARATRRRRAAAGQPDAPAPAAKKRSAAATTGSAAAGEGSEQPRRSRRARP